MEIGEILTIGATKYADYNWAKGIKFSRLFAACLRHLWAYWGGEDLDPETGKCHLAHAACCITFMMELRHTKPEMDDRPRWIEPEPDFKDFIVTMPCDIVIDESD